MPDEWPTGHQETQPKIPDPLESPRFPNPLAGLPSYVLSRTSIVILAAILLLPVVNRPAWYVFKLPVAPAWLLGLAVGLAASVLLVCRHRPGRLFPRLWALLLTLAALLALLGRLVGVAPRGVESPYSHLTALALLCAAASLAPRLTRLHPDSVWIRRIPYVSVAIGCSCFLALYLSSARGIDPAAQERFATVLREIRHLTSAAENAAAHKWPSVGGDLTATKAIVDELSSLTVPPDCRDRSFWRLAAAAGKVTELKAAIRETVQATADALKSDLVPEPVSEPGDFYRRDSKTGKLIHVSEEVQLKELIDGFQKALKGLFEDLSTSFLTIADESPGELRDFSQEIEAEKAAAFEKAFGQPASQSR